MPGTEAVPLKPRHEIVRILMFLGITLGVQVLATLTGVLLTGAGFVFIAGLFPAVDSFGTLGIPPVLMIFFVGPAAAAAYNRILTFRAAGKWWPGPLLMAGLSILLALLDHGLYLLGVESTALLACGLAALWLIASYVLQRWALYRKTLDTLHDSPDETEISNEEGVSPHE